MSNPIPQLQNESIRDYKFFLEYLQNRSIPELDKTAKVGIRQLYNIAKKNDWEARIKEFDEVETSKFISSHFKLLQDYTKLNLENTLNLAMNIQHSIKIYNDNFQNINFTNIGENETQIDVIKELSRSTRLIHSLLRAARLVEDKMKSQGMDITKLNELPHLELFANTPELPPVQEFQPVEQPQESQEAELIKMEKIIEEKAKDINFKMAALKAIEEAKLINPSISQKEIQKIYTDMQRKEFGTNTVIKAIPNHQKSLMKKIRG